MNPLEQLVQAAVASIRTVLESGKSCALAFSSGKDSSVVAGLLLLAARACRQAGVALKPILVTHGDTGVENPEVHQNALAEMRRIEQYCARYDIPVQILVAKPYLSESWQCRVIGGRALPSMPGTNHDCSSDMKVRPMTRLRSSIVGRADVVTAIGTRFEESPQRAARMRERGETPDKPWQGDDGGWYISPIALWGMEDVWEFLGLCRAGDPAYLTYSRHDDIFRIYADAAGESCAVVADMASQGKKSKPCGARTGCWACTPVGRDKSLETMIEGDPRYAYLRGLNQLQRFLLATRWDLSRRNWLGRSVTPDGHIAIGPDVYSPAMLESLLRYCLTLDVLERSDAARLGIKPRFEIIDFRSLIAIDAMWNLQGLARPFAALRIYRNVVEHRNLAQIPQLEAFPKPKMPKARWLYVGKDWPENTSLVGLRDVMQEFAVGGNDSYCMGTRQLKDGRTIMDVQTAAAFDIDEDGLNDFLAFEFDRVLEESDGCWRDGPTDGYLYYSRMGFLQLAPQALGTMDEILRRTWWKHRVGLFGQLDPSVLIDRSVEKRPASPAGDGEELEEPETADVELSIPDAPFGQAELPFAA